MQGRTYRAKPVPCLAAAVACVGWAPFPRQASPRSSCNRHPGRNPSTVVKIADGERTCNPVLPYSTCGPTRCLSVGVPYFRARNSASRSPQKALAEKALGYRLSFLNSASAFESKLPIFVAEIDFGRTFGILPTIVSITAAGRPKLINCRLGKNSWKLAPLVSRMPFGDPL